MVIFLLENQPMYLERGLKMANKRVRRAFPTRQVESMYRAIMSGNEGAVANSLKNGEQVWRSNLSEHLQKIDILGEIKKKAHPVAFKLLQKYGTECKTRFRPYPHYFNGRFTDGKTMCTQNSINHAINTGMELWSGYACTRGTAAWHLWNVDAQGYVYDATYTVDSIFGRYFGIRLDPFHALELLEYRASGLEGVFIYWGFFPKIAGLIRRKLGEKDGRRSKTNCNSLVNNHPPSPVRTSHRHFLCR
jgi:hypothetical protein